MVGQLGLHNLYQTLLCAAAAAGVRRVATEVRLSHEQSFLVRALSRCVRALLRNYGCAAAAAAEQRTSENITRINHACAVGASVLHQHHAFDGRLIFLYVGISTTWTSPAKIL